MSAFEHLFLDPGHAEESKAVADLAASLGLRTVVREGRVFLSTDRLAPSAGHIGGRFEQNVYGQMGPDDAADADETDVAIYDDMPFVWSLWAAEGQQSVDLDEQARRARVAFELVAARLGWPVMLVHDFEVLVATYDPDRGVREFPPGTWADGRHRHLWA